MKKYLIALYGLVSYGIFFCTYLYLIAFLANIIAPTTIDGNPSASVATAVLINLGLIALFGVAHSTMARSWFKDWWTQYIPKAAERSTYVLQASILLFLILWNWQSLTATIWTVGNPTLRIIFWALFVVGHVIVLTSTFLINHFELTGLQQVWTNLRGKQPAPMKMRTPLLYRYVRHPMQLGVVIGIWATPDMTVGHLLFAVALTIYIFIGLHFEEKALVREFGDDYRHYQQTTPMLIPTFRRYEPVGQPASGD